MALDAVPLRSPPAQNALSSPVSTMTATDRSSSHFCIAARVSASIVSVSALRTSGRANCTIPAAPCVLVLI